jgi:small multidrug resistance pump
MNYLAVIAGLAANSLASILLKFASSRGENILPELRIFGFALNLPSALALVCYGASFFIYAWGLRTSPLHTLQPLLTGGTIAIVAVCSFFLFGELMSVKSLIGIGLVLAGSVLLIGAI